MKTSLLSVLILSASLRCFATVWTISNTGNTFSPATVTINFGDSVKFVLAQAHDAREVSQQTWNTNGNTALAGGFQTPFGGGLVLPANLSAGTHYYVCTPHAGVGMKGRIIVQNATGIAENREPAGVSIFPNPSKGEFQLILSNFNTAKNVTLQVYNILGENIYQTESSSMKPGIDLSGKHKGVYFLRVSDGQAILIRKIIIE